MVLAPRGGIAGKIEEKFGLPKLQEVSEALNKLSHLLEGERGKRLERLISNLRELAQDHESAEHAERLLTLLERLDQEGTLMRFDQVLKDIKPVMNSRLTKDVVGRLSQLGDLLDMLQQLTGGDVGPSP
jgi:ABC-type transporter Mla subunit MlaD